MQLQTIIDILRDLDDVRHEFAYYTNERSKKARETRRNNAIKKLVDTIDTIKKQSI